MYYEHEYFPIRAVCTWRKEAIVSRISRYSEVIYGVLGLGGIIRVPRFSIYLTRISWTCKSGFKLIDGACIITWWVYRPFRLLNKILIMCTDSSTEPRFRTTVDEMNSRCNCSSRADGVHVVILIPAKYRSIIYTKRQALRSRSRFIAGKPKEPVRNPFG